jgi:hypothetical protein
VIIVIASLSLLPVKGEEAQSSSALARDRRCPAALCL